MDLTPEEEQAAIELAHRITDVTGSVPMQFLEYWKGQVQHTDIVRLARALLSLKGKLEAAEQKLKSYGEYIEHASRVMDNGGYIDD